MPEFKFSQVEYFPFDNALERLDAEAKRLGLTPENLCLAEKEEAALTYQVKAKLAELKKKAGIADSLSESITYLRKNEARLDDLEVIARRAEETEAYVKDLMIKLTWTQFKKWSPWMLSVLMGFICLYIAVWLPKSPSQSIPATELNR